MFGNFIFQACFLRTLHDGEIGFSVSIVLRVFWLCLCALGQIRLHSLCARNRYMFSLYLRALSQILSYSVCDRNSDLILIFLTNQGQITHNLCLDTHIHM